jgi:hypothetical protein
MENDLGQIQENFYFKISNLDLINRDETFLRLQIRLENGVFYKELSYETPDENLLYFSVEEKGTFTARFQLIKVASQNAISSDEPISFDVREFNAFIGNIPDTVFVLEEITLDILHNFIIFPDLNERFLFNWEFGDGQSESLAPPGDTSVRFSRAGDYTIKLTVENLKAWDY